MYTERLNDKEKNERNMDGLLTRGLKDINKKKTQKQEEESGKECVEKSTGEQLDRHRH